MDLVGDDQHAVPGEDPKKRTQFFVRNVKNYHRDDLPIHFVGSIAAVYEAELREAATALGLTMDHIIKAPLEGLCAYHAGPAGS